MKTYIKRLFSDSMAFAVATFGNKLIAALLAPVFLRHLTGEGQLADWGLTNTYTLILTYISMLGTDMAMAFYFYDAKTEQDRKAYFFNAVLLSSGICTLFVLVTVVFGGSLSHVLYKSAFDNHQVLALATTATLGAVIIQHILGYARYNRQIWLFNTFSMAYVIGSSLFSVYFVLQGKGVVGIFYGQLIGQVTIALVLLVLFRKEFSYQISLPHLKQLIAYGAPLLPTLLSFWAITSISRPIIIYMSSLHNADIYEATIRVATFIVLLTAPFHLAWRPFSMSIKDREDAPQIFGLVARLLLVVGTLAVMGMTFFVDPLFQLFVGRPNLSSGYVYVWLLSLGTLFNVLHTVFGVGLLIKKQTQKISKAFVLAAVIYVAGCLILVPRFHIWGAAVMTLVVYMVVTLLVYKQSQRVYPVPFRFGAIAGYMGIYIACMIGITVVQLEELAHAWAYYLVAFMITLLTAMGTKLVDVRLLVARLRRKEKAT